MLPDNHELYSSYGRSFSTVTFSNFILALGQLHLCEGVQSPDPDKASFFQKHIVPKTFSTFF